MTTFAEYQAATARTAGAHDGADAALCNWSMGLAGEAGELVDLVKKSVFHGKKYTRRELIGEMGDVLWYLARLAAECNVSLDEVAEANIEKLRNRYPEGFVSGGGVR